MSSFNNDNSKKVNKNKKVPIKEINQNNDHDNDDYDDDHDDDDDHNYYCHGCESGTECPSSHTEKCQQMTKYRDLLHKQYLTQSVLVDNK